MACGRTTYLPREEQQDVALWLCEVDLHDGDERCIHVVRLWRARVQDFHRVCAPWDGEDGAVEEIGRELVSIQRRRSHDQLQVWPACDDALHAQVVHVTQLC